MNTDSAPITIDVSSGKRHHHIKVSLISKYANVYFRQSPSGDGRWGEIQLVSNASEGCDYFVVLNGPEQPMTVQSPGGRLWLIMQEPPTEFWKMAHPGGGLYDSVFTSDTDLKGESYSLSQPAVPWHVNKTYSDLQTLGIPAKRRLFSAIISDQNILLGHRIRLKFVEKLKQFTFFEHFGRGFQPIEDKWDGLADFNYSLAIENFRNDYYWTEKIADCFLSWTMPVYCGCSRITQYFPPESMIMFDIDDKLAPQFVSEQLKTNRWRKNLDAIEHARNLVLNRYQLLPLLDTLIRSRAGQDGSRARNPYARNLPVFSAARPAKLIEFYHRARTRLARMTRF